MTEVKTYSQMRREFYDKFKNIIIPKIKYLDNRRKARLITAIIGSTILFILGLLCLLSLINGSSRYDEDVAEGMLKLACFLFFASFGYWTIIKKGFENHIKEKIMPIVCSCFDNLKWSNQIYNSDEKIFSNSSLIPEFTSSVYDDIFYGSYKDVNFEIIESEFIRGSGKSSTTVFKGVIVKLDMNKRFNSNTVIRPDSLLHLSPSKLLKHTTLEDVLFEKNFDVFTDDEVDARYLITPSFMERLNKMKTAFTANKISCAFYGTHLLVGLETKKDLFSLCSLVKSIDDPKQYYTMYEEIISIIKLIDHFKLNQKIGL